MRFETFEKSFASSASNQFDSVGISVLEDSERESFTKICTSKQVNDAKRAYDTFVEKRSEENPTFALCSKYIDMVQLLLLYIRATRTSNWKLPLSSLRSMIPCFFATDRNVVFRENSPL
jgi:hypothetical protein